MQLSAPTTSLDSLLLPAGPGVSGAVPGLAADATDCVDFAALLPSAPTGADATPAVSPLPGAAVPAPFSPVVSINSLAPVSAPAPAGGTAIATSPLPSPVTAPAASAGAPQRLTLAPRSARHVATTTTAGGDVASPAPAASTRAGSATQNARRGGRVSSAGSAATGTGPEAPAEATAASAPMTPLVSDAVIAASISLPTAPRDESTELTLLEEAASDEPAAGHSNEQGDAHATFDTPAFFEQNTGGAGVADRRMDSAVAGRFAASAARATVATAPSPLAGLPAVTEPAQLLETVAPVAAQFRDVAGAELETLGTSDGRLPTAPVAPLRAPSIAAREFRPIASRSETSEFAGPLGGWATRPPAGLAVSSHAIVGLGSESEAAVSPTLESTSCAVMGRERSVMPPVPETSHVSFPFSSLAADAALAPEAEIAANAMSRSLTSESFVDERSSVSAPAENLRLGDATSAEVEPAALLPERSETAVWRPRAAATRSAAKAGEIFAAASREAMELPKSALATSDKNFLSADSESVATHQSELGTVIANSESIMPEFHSTQRTAPEAVHPRAAAVNVELAGAGQPTAADASATAPAPTPATAHRAVEAVLTAVERFGAAERHAVNLQFSVGGADLAVRVELRADEVRATFRTDSPELRAALAHEWQAVAVDSDDRPFRLAPAVITSNQADGSALSAFVGDGSSRQRDSQARRTAKDVFASIASRSRGFASHAAVEIAAPLARAALLPTSLHLHTHA